MAEQENRSRGARALIEQATLIEYHAARARTLHGIEQELHSDPIHALRMAEPMYCATRCCDLVVEAASRIPDWPLAPHDLFIPRAFVWLERPAPLLTVSAAGDRWNTFVTAWAWAPWIETAGPVYAGRGPSGLAEGVALFGWQEGLEFPFPAMWRWGETREQVVTKIMQGALAADYPRLATLHPDAVRDQALSVLTAFQAMVTFIKQRIFVKERYAPETAARKLAERAGIRTGDTTVITLRRVAQPEPGTGSDPIDWNQRWWVHGHWRMQACGPEMTDRRPTWISPYVKGPEDKPLAPLKPRRFEITR